MRRRKKWSLKLKFQKMWFLTGQIYSTTSRRTWSRKGVQHGNRIEVLSGAAVGAETDAIVLIRVEVVRDEVGTGDTVLDGARIDTEGAAVEVVGHRVVRGAVVVIGDTGGAIGTAMSRAVATVAEAVRVDRVVLLAEGGADDPNVTRLDTSFSHQSLTDLD